MAVLLFFLTWSVLGNLRKIYDDDNSYFIIFQHFVVMFVRFCIHLKKIHLNRTVIITEVGATTPVVEAGHKCK